MTAIVQTNRIHLSRTESVFVAGHNGLVGSAIWRRMHEAGFTDLVGRSSRDLDLTDRKAVFTFFNAAQPSVVVLAAAKVGGIRANNSYPADFISHNLQIQANVLDAAVAVGTPRLLFLGSSCIYPKHAPQPIPEAALLTGYLEPTNDAYAIAKIAGIVQVQAIRRQHGLSWISAMPTNLYGPGDNFSPEASHVLPALIRRYEQAAREGLPTVKNWGTGTPRRELLHVDDMADACLHLLENYDAPGHVNVGVGRDTTIAQLAELVADATGFTGTTEWDSSMPDGTAQKLLDVKLLENSGWSPKIGLREGISSTVAWYRRNRDRVRT
jgi:GDP-L-fucose synthase